MKNPEFTSESSVSIPEKFFLPWPDELKHHTSVYHYTDKEALEKIANQGLTHFSDRIEEGSLDTDERKRILFDNICDQISQEMGVEFKRSKAVFAGLSPENDTANWSRFGTAALEIKVDPETTYVYDRYLHSGSAIAYDKTQEGEKFLEKYSPEQKQQVETLLQKFPLDYKTYLKEYIAKRVKLSDYLALSPEEREQKIHTPEIALSAPVDPKLIRMKQFLNS